MNFQKFLEKGKKYLLSPQYRFLIQANLGVYYNMPDEKFLSRMFQILMNQELSLEHPKTFNEKLQWLKLYNRKTSYTTMVDKYKVREYIRERLGEKYLIPLLGVWNNPEEIDFDILPNQFVLKCNHNSGLGMSICKDKVLFDFAKAKKDLRRGIRENYYQKNREWPYKDVPRKIIAEQYMKSDAGGLTDYKIHCFNGEPKLILVCKDRFLETGLTEDFFSINWEHLDIRRPKHPNASAPIKKPEELDEMLRLAAILSKDIPFLRVDFYIVDHKIYFSELTFYPASGFDKFVPEIWDNILGDWLKLPEKT